MSAWPGSQLRTDCAVIWQDIKSTKRPSKAAQYTGWEASSRSISEALQRERPVDGILGESSLPPDHCHWSDRKAVLSAAERATGANNVPMDTSQWP